MVETQSEQIPGKLNAASQKSHIFSSGVGGDQKQRESLSAEYVKKGLGQF